MDFALRVVRMFSQLPKSTQAQVLGKQLLRSGTSIGANYREAFADGAKLSLWRNAATACVKLKNGACREAAT